MTGNHFVPLTLQLIEEGAFLDAINAAIANTQAQLVAHVEEHGERAGKAKATVEVTIALKCEKPEPGDSYYSISPSLVVKLPARPVKVTAAMSGYDPKRKEPCLFVRHTGSTEGDPNQMHLPMGEAPTKPEDARSEAS